MLPEKLPESSALHQFLSGNGLSYCFPAMQTLYCSPFYTTDMSESVEKPETRSFSASENHREAERKRRERINTHLDTLRVLLLCNSKTDKASLLAKVVQRVRELKQQTSRIKQFDQTIPFEEDEITVTHDNDFNGKSVLKASLCCEDRVDLIPDLIETLNSLNLSLLRSEIVTLGGRIRNVMFLNDDGQKNQTDDESVLLLKDSLKTLILHSSYGEKLKRRRLFDQRIIS